MVFLYDLVCQFSFWSKSKQNKNIYGKKQANKKNHQLNARHILTFPFPFSLIVFFTERVF